MTHFAISHKGIPQIKFITETECTSFDIGRESTLSEWFEWNKNQ